MRPVPRRTVLRGAALLPLAAALPRGLLRAAMAQTTPWRAFDEHQGAVVVAATARLIPGPTDDPTETDPGAREANVTRYIDLMLSAFDESVPLVFADGPFSDRGGGAVNSFLSFVPLSAIQDQVWRERIAALRVAYEDGIAALDDAAGGDFTTIPGVTQDLVLAGDPSGFRDLVFGHAIEGMYAAPEYGGNEGLIGWESISFPGDRQPTGYSDEEVSSSDGVDIADPIGLPFLAADLPGFLESAAPHLARSMRRGR